MFGYIVVFVGTDFYVLNDNVVVDSEVICLILDIAEHTQLILFEFNYSITTFFTILINISLGTSY